MPSKEKKKEEAKEVERAIARKKKTERLSMMNCTEL
jgi:hypothetical protein